MAESNFMFPERSARGCKTWQDSKYGLLYTQIQKTNPRVYAFFFLLLFACLFGLYGFGLVLFGVFNLVFFFSLKIVSLFKLDLISSTSF